MTGRSKSKAKRPQKATKPVKSPKTLVHDLSGAIREPLRAPVHMRSAWVHTPSFARAEPATVRGMQRAKHPRANALA